MDDPFPSLELPAATMLRAMREAVIGIDEEQRIVLFNPAAERMFGCSAAQALDCRLERFVPMRHRARHATHVREFGASEEAERPMDQRLPVSALRADGTEFPIAATISRTVIATASGPRRLLLAMLRDISEEVSLYADLARAMASVRALIELAPVATWIVDGPRVVSANRACARLFGIDEAALIGSELMALMTPESMHAIERASTAARAEPGLVVHADARVRRPDGTQREVEVATTALPDQRTSTLQMALVDVTERLAETQAMAQSRSEMREFAARAVRAREDERRRISRELHDDLGQRLTAIKMGISAVATRVAPPGGDGQELIAQVDETIAAVRRIASDLRPPMLDDLGLFAALDWLGRSAQRRLGIDVQVRVPAQDAALPSEAAVALYRIVQESLTNAARHGGATRVQVQACATSGELLITVHDNGRGFRNGSTQGAPSFGLIGMRERALMVGGSVEFDNAPAGGARVTARVPIGG